MSTRLRDKGNALTLKGANTIKLTLRWSFPETQQGKLKGNTVRILPEATSHSAAALATVNGEPSAFLATDA